MNTGTISSRICDMGLDIQKIFKKIAKLENANKNLNQSLDEEIEKRHQLEKKLISINDCCNCQIENLNKKIENSDQDLEKKMLKMKNDILQDVQERNSNFMQILQSNLDIKANQPQINYLQNHNLDSNNNNSNSNPIMNTINQGNDKYEKLQNLIQNEFDKIKKDINSSKIRIEFIEERLKEISSNITKDIISIHNDLLCYKNEFTELKNNKIVSNQNNDNLKKTGINNQNSILSNSDKLNSFIKEIEIKTKTYEDILQSHTNNFQILKNDMTNRFKEINSNVLMKIKSISDGSKENMIKQNEEFEHFEKHFIGEYEKFVSYIQSLFDKQNENVKKIMNFTNADIDMLREKNLALEHSMNQLKTELLKNVNQIEEFLSKKYDSLYRIINKN